jgi:hypothetical protein
MIFQLLVGHLNGRLTNGNSKHKFDVSEKIVLITYTNVFFWGDVSLIDSLFELETETVM